MRLKRSDYIATRAKIIAVAERLFSEYGIDGVSVSMIHKASGQRNTSAVNYYFGSKEGIIRAILEKHEPDIGKQINERLAAVSASGLATRRQIIEAIVTPLADKLNDPDGGVAFLRLMSQLFGHPRFSIAERSVDYINHNDDIISKLARQRSWSASNMQTWISSWIISVGLIYHALADYSRLAENASAKSNLPSQETFVQNLVDAYIGLTAITLPYQISIGGGSAKNRVDAVPKDQAKKTIKQNS